MKNILSKIDIAIRFFLYLLIFWLPYSKAVVESSVIAAFVLWMLKKIIAACASGKFDSLSRLSVKDFVLLFKPPPSFLNGLIGIFLTFALVSALTGVSPRVSVYGLFTKTCEWFLIYFLMIEVFTEKKYVYRALYVFVFTSLATVLDSLSQFYWTHKDIFLGYVMSDNRATAGFNHANNLAGYLTFVVPVTISLFWRSNKKWKTLLGILGALLSIWSLGLTFSRGAWLATAAGILFFLFLTRSPRWDFISLGIILVIIACGIFLTIPGKEMRLEHSSIINMVNYRENLWEDSWRMILNRPSFGYGPNTFMSEFFDFGRALRGTYAYTPTYAHNCFIQLAAEEGLIGLAVFLGIMGQLFIKVTERLKITKKNPTENKRLQLLSAGILSGTLAFLLHSFVDTNLFSLQLSALLWFMVGLQIAIYHLQFHKKDETETLRLKPIHVSINKGSYA